MSEYETPIGPLFDLGRETLKRGADVLRAGRSARDDLATMGLQASETFGTGALELGRRSVTCQLAVAETATGVETNHSVLNETAGLLQTRHGSAHEAATETYEQVDTALAIREAEQLAALIDTSERVETHLVDAVAELDALPTRGNEATVELLDYLERGTVRRERSAGSEDVRP